MENIFRHRITRDGNEYEITFGFDDNAIMENSAKFEIVGLQRRIGQKNWKKVALILDVIWPEERIDVYLEGKKLGSIPLNLPLPPMTDDSGSDIDHDMDAENIATAINAEAVRSEIEARVVEEGIHWIPTDPFLGCILKGAMSTVLGQIIRCYGPVRHVNPYRERAKMIAKCLKKYSGRMLLTFVYRAGRCAVFVGLR